MKNNMGKQIARKEISYIHNGNVTVCMIKFWLSEDFWNEVVDADLDTRLGIDFYGEPLIVKGISKCQDGDVYDQKTGNYIARTKAFDKMTRKMYKINLALLKYHNDEARKFCNYIRNIKLNKSL